MSTILTIGHSTHTIETFVDLLQCNDVTAIADVRSSPFSKFNPQFNRDNLRPALQKSGIAYVFLGRELGARSDDPTHYDGNRVVYERLAASDGFRAGINRVVSGQITHKIALMCAEKDPITCHRTILVARELERLGHDIGHIQADGTIEPHHEAIERLMTVLGMNPNDLFTSRCELEDQAYKAQELRIAYVRQDIEQAT